MKLILVRHGESQGNVDHNVYKNTRNCDIPLSDRGVDQCINVANLLSENLKNEESISIFSSPYRRALDTATIIRTELDGSHVLQFRKHFSLCEQDYSTALGCDSLADFCATDDKENRLYDQAGEVNYILPRGESLRDVYVRCGLFVERNGWFSSSKCVIIVAHKGTCNMLEAYLLNDGDPKMGKWWNAEARVYSVSRPLGRAVLVKNECVLGTHSTPGNEELLKWAKNSPPPDEWYNDDANPFKPEGD